MTLLKPISSQRTGFAVPMAVIMLVILGIAIFSMMIFSGSQTRSMRNDIEMWQARELAISGIKVAGEKLRKERWYGKSSVVGSLSAKVSKGGYVIVCEDTKRVLDFSSEYENAADRVVYDGKKYSRLAVLDHIDVFCRAFYGKQSVVAYGRFIIGPEPDFLSRSTDGLIRTEDGKSLIAAPFTMKRMVAITVIRDKSLFDISVREVRNSIRAKVAVKTGNFIANYAKVRWDAGPPATISTTLDTNSAKGILATYWGNSGPNNKNVFLRDRIKQFILEGTAVTARGTAPEKRSFHIKKSTGNLRSKYPTLPWPAPVSVQEDFTAPNAFETLEAEVGASPSSDEYREQMSYNVVGTSCKVSWVEGGQPTLQLGGPIVKPYTINDGALGVEGIPVDSAFGFFEKYFQKGTAEVLGSDSAEAFSQDVYEEIKMSGDGDSGQASSDGTEGDSWENNPVIEPGPPEPLPEATSGNSPGTPEDLGSEIIPDTPGSGGSSGGGNVSGSC